MNDPGPATSPVTRWLDRFFADYCSARPVNATFLGVHDHDDRLPDFSENGQADAVAAMQTSLDESLGLEPASGVEAVDLRLAQGHLRIQLWEYASAHFHRGNPSTHTGEAVFGTMSPFLSDYAPLGERAAAAAARMRGLPTYLEAARAAVREAPLEWTRRAIRECRGGLAFLSDGIAHLAGEPGLDAKPLRAAAATAAAALASHREHLEKVVSTRPTAGYASGEEALALYLRDGHCLTETAGEIERRAQSELARAEAQLEEHAADHGGACPAEALAGLAELHPTLARYPSRYQELWDAVRACAEERELITWPDFPIRYVPRPAWARAAAPDLYFLFYRSPAAFGRPPVHDYLVTPIDTATPAEERERLLAAHNDSVIKLNHVVHHGGIGHHVQNFHAFKAASRIGRVAAVDCASRIAFFCGGTMAEGWACYATDLMAEAGFLTPLERYAEQQGRARMCARAIVDVRLHQGRMSLEEAAAFYREHAGMPAEAALGEAVKNSMFPGAAVMYMVGRDAIHALRREIEALDGGRFRLRAFHDELLAHGSLPVSRIGEAMKAKRRHAE